MPYHMWSESRGVTVLVLINANTSRVQILGRFVGEPVEYTDYITFRRVRFRPKMDVLEMTLKWIWWYTSVLEL